MSKHIIKFDSHSEYEEFLESGDYIEPHVSLCSAEGHVNYNLKSEQIKVYIDPTSDFFEPMTIWDNSYNVLCTVDEGVDAYIDMPEDNEIFVQHDSQIYFNGVQPERAEGTSHKDGKTYDIYTLPDDVKTIMFLLIPL